MKQSHFNMVGSANVKQHKIYLDQWIIVYVCFVQPCGHLLGTCWPLGSPVCDVFLWFCHFPIQCPGSGVVLDRIDFCS